MRCGWGGRRKLLGWIGLIVTAVLAPWILWTHVRSGDPPVLACSQSVYDFGDLEADAVVEHEFVLTNRGKEMVTGLRAMSGCGCISVQLSGESIAPAETVKAFVRMEVKTLHGKVELKVYVSGEGRSGKPATLWLRGVVKEK